MRLPFWLLAPEALGEILHHLIEPHMRIPALEEVEQMLAQNLSVIILFLHDDSPSAEFRKPLPRRAGPRPDALRETRGQSRALPGASAAPPFRRQKRFLPRDRCGSTSA